VSEQIDAARPLGAFNFRVELSLPGESNPVCLATFSECDGLEMSMEAKTIREGGNNGRQIHLVGPVTYGQLSLKRGMTETADSSNKIVDLWEWFEKVQGSPNLRAHGEISLLSRDRARTTKRFLLTGCLPLKIRAQGFNAQDGVIAVEEMQIAYETMERVVEA
jgi:phage tail-like protein